RQRREELRRGGLRRRDGRGQQRRQRSRQIRRQRGRVDRVARRQRLDEILDKGRVSQQVSSDPFPIPEDVPHLTATAARWFGGGGDRPVEQGGDDQVGVVLRDHALASAGDVGDEFVRDDGQIEVAAATRRVLVLLGDSAVRDVGPTVV